MPLRRQLPAAIQCVEGALRHAVVADDEEADLAARAVDSARHVGAAEVDDGNGARHAVMTSGAPA